MKNYARIISDKVVNVEVYVSEPLAESKVIFIDVTGKKCSPGDTYKDGTFIKPEKIEKSRPDSIDLSVMTMQQKLDVIIKRLGISTI